MFSRLKRVLAEAAGGGQDPFTVFVVQHAEALDGDAHLALSRRGREQATAFASSMKRGDIDIFVTGPLQASRETAETMQSAIGGELVVLDEFGGLDRTGADRFLRGLDVVRARYAPAHHVMVVSDGERTLNAVRSLRSDVQIELEAPGALEQGIPPCAMTTFVWRKGAWDVEEIAALTIPDM